MLQLLRADELQPGHLVAQAGPCATATDNPMPLRFEAVYKADKHPDGVHVLWNEAAGRYVYQHDRIFLVETSTAEQSEYARLQPDLDFREQLQQALIDGVHTSAARSNRIQVENEELFRNIENDMKDRLLYEIAQAGPGEQIRLVVRAGVETKVMFRILRAHGFTFQFGETQMDRSVPSSLRTAATAFFDVTIPEKLPPPEAT